MFNRISGFGSDNDRYISFIYFTVTGKTSGNYDLVRVSLLWIVVVVVFYVFLVVVVVVRGLCAVVLAGVVKLMVGTSASFIYGYSLNHRRLRFG